MKKKKKKLTLTEQIYLSQNLFFFFFFNCKTMIVLGKESFPPLNRPFMTFERLIFLLKKSLADFVFKSEQLNMETRLSGATTPLPP